MTAEITTVVNDKALKLAKPPIVEAVLDVDCDMPPGLDMAAVEQPARAAFAEDYPELRKVFLQEHLIEQPVDGPPNPKARRGIQAFQFVRADGRQLVQVRAQGYSFNRLAPYSGLDDYLPEIERTWERFVRIVSPSSVQVVRLHYINRIRLPTRNERVDVSRYVRISPRLPDEQRLEARAFLDQQVLVEKDTGNQVTIVLASQPLEGKMQPLILDIEASRAESIEPSDWHHILEVVQSLRDLKNMVFRGSLTARCLERFR